MSPAPEIHPLATLAEAEACAAFMAATEPWRTLQRDQQACLLTLTDPSRERYVAYQGGQLVGCLVLNLLAPSWATSKSWPWRRSSGAWA